MKNKSTTDRFYQKEFAAWAERLLRSLGVNARNDNFDIELTTEELEADLRYGQRS